MFFFQNIAINMRFQVLTAANMKFRVIWDVAPCSHVEVVHFNMATRRYSPETLNLLR
jgi:hypothetical protein